MGFLECLKDDCQHKIHQEEVTNNNDKESVKESDNWEVHIHHIACLLVKGLTSNHLEHSQEGITQVIEVNDAELNVRTIFKVL